MGEIREVRLEGHLTRNNLEAALGGVDQRGGAYRLLLDALAMTGYDLEARHAFVAWNRRNRSGVDRVAIVTERTMWRAVIAAMALASGQDMRAFTSPEGARDWLAGATDKD
jgi:hypothetical protein